MSVLERPMPSHFGIFVTNLDRMVSFYTSVFLLTITDRGVGRTFRNELVFMSASKDHHHQLVLASGRPESANFSTVMQISFKVADLRMLRETMAAAERHGATAVRGLNHGNAWSVYFSDPEGNTVEIYVDTPFYIAQPHGVPLDLGKPDEEILKETEAICKNDPTFLPVDEWRKTFTAT